MVVHLAARAQRRPAAPELGPRPAGNCAERPGVEHGRGRMPSGGISGIEPQERGGVAAAGRAERDVHLMRNG